MTVISMEGRGRTVANGKAGEHHNSYLSNAQ
jgi:hypothetical protein